MKNIYIETCPKLTYITYLGHTRVVAWASILQWIKFILTKQFWYKLKTKMKH